MTKEIIDSLSEVAVPSKDMHLAIGMFDGIHIGHQAVIDSAIHAAKSEEGVSGVLTFSPHPSRLITPSNPTQLIMQSKIKYNFLKNLGVDYVFQKRFTLEFAKIPAEDFVKYLKDQLPSLKAIYVGENFKFGHYRKGDIDLLVNIAKPLDIDVFSIERVNHNGERISSTRIRKLLNEGSIKEANKLLGYHYFTVLDVIPGQKRGKQTGFHTLNMKWDVEIKPKYGVYAVHISNKNEPGKQLAIANFGFRPTFADIKEPLLEVHVLNKQDVSFGDGDRLKVELLDFVRPEQKFESIEQLSSQIKKDCAFVIDQYGV